jgi:hypothetical protein
MIDDDDVYLEQYCGKGFHINYSCLFVLRKTHKLVQEGISNNGCYIDTNNNHKLFCKYVLFVYTYMYIFAYIKIHICIYFTYTYIHICIHTYLFMCTYIYTYL